MHLIFSVRNCYVYLISTCNGESDLSMSVHYLKTCIQKMPLRRGGFRFKIVLPQNSSEFATELRHSFYKPWRVMHRPSSESLLHFGIKIHQPICGVDDLLVDLSVRVVCPSIKGLHFSQDLHTLIQLHIRNSMQTRILCTNFGITHHTARSLQTLTIRLAFYQYPGAQFYRFWQWLVKQSFWSHDMHTLYDMILMFLISILNPTILINT